MEKGARDFLKRQETYRDAQLVQITFIGQLRLTPIREITAAEVNRMLLVPGIVINAGHTRPRAIKLSVRCRECNHEKLLDVPPEGCTIPSSCPGGGGGGGVEGAGGGAKRCPRDSFEVHPDHCEYVDEQRLKLQEAPETVPTGEMPRTMEVIVDRVYAGRISPGTRVRMLAIACIRRGEGAGGGRGGGGGGGGGRSGAVALRHPYLRVVGVVGDEEGGGRQAITTFTPEEEARMKALAADPDIFARLAASVAPSIAGDYTDDIKKAILCLLLGGRWKRLPDGMRLRGDINMLMLGDPSTAKSQFLKFVERVAPVSVYTSGKGSSAAGLTASVVKDMRGEFRLEGGAMVLADGGVVCIDEFDKMRDEDRVAIHEVRGGRGGGEGATALLAAFRLLLLLLLLLGCCWLLAHALPFRTLSHTHTHTHSHTLHTCPAGHGAADHFRGQGGHHHHPQLPLQRAGCRQPKVRPLRRLKVHCRQH
jgi:DNA replication licensing factor MCM5